MSEGIDAPEGNNRRLNRFVAITVVILSVAMAVGKIKDDNIVQAMQADQASRIDLWGEYQAARIKAHDQRIAATLLGQSAKGGAEAARAVNAGARYDRESAVLKSQALAAMHDYDVEGRRDDQFDLADGFMSTALAVAAIAALVERFRLLAAGWVSAALGLLFLIAGFAGLPIHPDALVAFLS
jgi:hypothetical protein